MDPYRAAVRLRSRLGEQHAVLSGWVGRTLVHASQGGGENDATGSLCLVHQQYIHISALSLSLFLTHTHICTSSSCKSLLSSRKGRRYISTRFRRPSEQLWAHSAPVHDMLTRHAFVLAGYRALSIFTHACVLQRSWPTTAAGTHLPVLEHVPLSERAQSLRNVRFDMIKTKKYEPPD